MIKRTLFFETPSYLNTKHNQLVVTYPNTEEKKTIPIEDIGLIVLEHQQITITNGLLQRLAENNVALIHCNSHHLPVGLLLPLVGHTEQSERYKHQIKASGPLKKNLWSQTVSAKILNQANALQEKNIPAERLLNLAQSVASGRPQKQRSTSCGFLLATPFPNKRLYPPPRGHTSKQFVKLWLCNTPGHSRSCLSWFRATPYSRYLPQKQIQPLLPRRRHYGTIPALLLIW